MPALMATDFSAKITWLGRVPDRAAGLVSQALTQAELGWGGIEGEAHGGVTRESCSRVSQQYEIGTEIRNVRQVSIISAEEMAQVAHAIGIETIAPEWMGASMVIEGLPEFSHVPPGSRLQAPSGATVVIDMENRPCIYPAQVIEAARPGHGKAFKTAAQGKRGVTAWVERPGCVAVGDMLRLHIPDQPVWAHLDQARDR